MDLGQYFESVTAELEALKDRVRHLIAGAHWQTDGEWKESVLRTILARHVPSHVGVGRGFVVEQDGNSRQIDVLLYDRRNPVLHREGELVFVTSDSVLGVIEVKSNLTPTRLRTCVEVLANTSELVRRNQLRMWQTISPRLGRFSRVGRYPQAANEMVQLRHRRRLVVGLFAYQHRLGKEPGDVIREKVQAAANGELSRVVTHIAAGNDSFVRFWENSPIDGHPYDSWRSYTMS